jgi:hypothetical protein
MEVFLQQLISDLAPRSHEVAAPAHEGDASPR